MKIGGWLPRWANLLLIGVLGVVLLIANAIWGQSTFLWGWGHYLLEVAKDVGIALVVASVLAKDI
jgi:hypothetical protein